MSLSAPTAIEPVRRAFAVLEVLNQQRSCTIAQLSGRTKLPQPTVARMLETLIVLGYVARISHTKGYRITNGVMRLAAGIRFIDRLVDAAVPRMDKFTRQTGWPLYLGTFATGAVLIRYSTAPLSPLSFETTGYDQRFNILESAIGRAILAFCEAADRAMILRDLAAIDGPHQEQLQQPQILQQDLFNVSTLGFAGVRSARQGRVRSLCVPVLQGGHAIAGLSLRYPRKAMSEAVAARQFIPKLQELARQIASATGNDK